VHPNLRVLSSQLNLVFAKGVYWHQTPSPRAWTGCWEELVAQAWVECHLVRTRFQMWICQCWCSLIYSTTPSISFCLRYFVYLMYCLWQSHRDIYHNTPKEESMMSDHCHENWCFCRDSRLVLLLQKVDRCQYLYHHVWSHQHIFRCELQALMIIISCVLLNKMK